MIRYCLVILFLIIGSKICLANENISQKKSFDEIANYLVGLDEKSEHTNQIDNLWTSYKNENLQKLIDWQKIELESKYPNDCHVFYPFSGPDILHPINLFPNCNKFTLIGLEPIGNIIDINITDINLPNLRNGLNSLLKRSFFVTKEMNSDFNLTNRGVILPIMTILKKLGYFIDDIRPVYLNEDGKIDESVKQGNNNGIKIIVKLNNITKEIYYFRKKLDNSNNVSRVFNYLNQQQNIITYLKAAQYALFDHNFSNLRDLILNKSSMILQDDSGIPYKFLKNSWDIKLYGDYKNPYGKEFKSYMQMNLLADYKRQAEISHLPFSLGYGYKKHNVILIKATRNGQ